MRRRVRSSPAVATGSDTRPVRPSVAAKAAECATPASIPMAGPVGAAGTSYSSSPGFGSSRNTIPRRREAVAAFILAGAWVYISLCSMKKDIRRGRSVVYSLTVHLVFVTKYRRNAITDRVRDHLGGTLGEVCAKMGCTLREFDGEDDHVHLLVDYPPKLAISRLVNSLKLVSARFLRKRNFPEVRRKLWGVHFWTPSYYAGSCGGANLQTVKRYIQAQRIPSRWARADSA